MAQSLTTMRNNAITSIHGRRLGLDRDEAIVGAIGVKQVITDLTSASTATVVPASGTVVCRMSGTATTAINGAFLLSNPIPGMAVNIVRANTSQAATAGSTAVAFQRATTAFYIQSSNKSTGVALLLADGQAAILLGISTDAYMALVLGSSAAPSITGTS